jgi:hypothetical protein
MNVDNEPAKSVFPYCNPNADGTFGAAGIGFDVLYIHKNCFVPAGDGRQEGVQTVKKVC